MIDGTKVLLGKRRVQLVAAQLEILDATPGEDGLVAPRLLPLGDNRDLTMRLVSANPSRSRDDTDEGENLRAGTE